MGDAQREAWLAQQAYDGALRALERHGRSRRDAQIAKADLSTLAESVLARLCRIVGGGANSRNSPLGHWFEDARAGGSLRPAWSVAVEGLYAIGWEMLPAAGAPHSAAPAPTFTGKRNVTVSLSFPNVLALALVGCEPPSADHFGSAD